jgi:hypothetical protein
VKRRRIELGLNTMSHFESMNLKAEEWTPNGLAMGGLGNFEKCQARIDMRFLRTPQICIIGTKQEKSTPSTIPLSSSFFHPRRPS